MTQCNNDSWWWVCGTSLSPILQLISPAMIYWWRTQLLVLRQRAWQQWLADTMQHFHDVSRFTHCSGAQFCLPLVFWHRQTSRRTKSCTNLPSPIFTLWAEASKLKERERNYTTICFFHFFRSMWNRLCSWKKGPILMETAAICTVSSWMSRILVSLKLTQQQTAAYTSVPDWEMKAYLIKDIDCCYRQLISEACESIFCLMDTTSDIILPSFITNQINSCMHINKIIMNCHILGYHQEVKWVIAPESRHRALQEQTLMLRDLVIP